MVLTSRVLTAFEGSARGVGDSFGDKAGDVTAFKTGVDVNNGNV